ncbi:MAG: DUF4124 domain-containing protein, partial [Woeseiaceae bacterium]|nr:DUF4124 domain-containing protein [Woeseiaceae bacterium]
MEIRAIFFLLGLLVANGALADAYKWVDEDGVVHFSDRPHPGAERVDLGPTTPSRPRPVRPGASSAPSSNDQASSQPVEPFSYTSLQVTSPAAEQTLWNIEGQLNVSLALNPALRAGHQVQVYFDGAARTVSGLSFQIDEVYRG